MCDSEDCRNRPLQACAEPFDNPNKDNAVMNETINIITFLGLASSCGLPAGTVKLTPPALTTCEGAVVKLMNVSRCSDLVCMQDACCV